MINHRRTISPFIPSKKLLVQVSSRSIGFSIFKPNVSPVSNYSNFIIHTSPVSSTSICISPLCRYGVARPKTTKFSRHCVHSPIGSINEFWLWSCMSTFSLKVNFQIRAFKLCTAMGLHRFFSEGSNFNLRSCEDFCLGGWGGGGWGGTNWKTIGSLSHAKTAHTHTGIRIRG